MSEMLQRAQRSLPKPVLFAIYGAIGGLLGALVLGEVLWWLLRPPVQQVKPALQLAASASLTLYQGGKNLLPIKVGRTGKVGPVTLKATDLPEGITVADVTIPEDKDEAKVEVVAAAGAAATSKEVKLIGSGGADTRADVKLKLTVKPPPPSLRLAMSPKVELFQGGKNRFSSSLGSAITCGAAGLRRQKPSGGSRAVCWRGWSAGRQANSSSR